MIKKRIFTFWENTKGTHMPAYINMCMETWVKNIPGLELVVLNFDNLFDWLDEDYVKKSDFKRVSLAQAKDIISYGIIYKHGGIFLDADTIAVKDIFDELELMDEEKLYLFGSDKTKNVHLGALFCGEPYNKALLECISRAKLAVKNNKRLLSKNTAYRLARNIIINGRTVLKGGKLSFQGYMPWHYFGNSVLDPIAKDIGFKDLLNIIDRNCSGAILEAQYFNSGAREDYLKFYFTSNNISVQEAINKACFGLICLHNSWTPNMYKSYTRERIMNDDVLLSKMLTHLM